MENSAQPGPDVQPEKSEARKKLETYAILGAMLAMDMNEAQAAEEEDREAMMDQDSEAERERELGEVDDDWDIPEQPVGTPGFRQKKFPVKERWVSNLHYRKDPRTGREFFLARSWGLETVKEISVPLIEANRRDFVKPVSVMVNTKANPVVRRHVVMMRPGELQESWIRGRGKQTERPAEPGVSDYDTSAVPGKQQ